MTELLERLFDLRHAQSEARTPEERAEIQAEIIELLKVIDGKE